MSTHRENSRTRQPMSLSGLIGAVMIVPMLVVGALALTPAPLALPAFASAAVLLGLTLACAAHVGKRLIPSYPARLMDLAAGLVFIGFAASIMADGDDVARALSGDRLAPMAQLHLK